MRLDRWVLQVQLVQQERSGSQALPGLSAHPEWLVPAAPLAPRELLVLTGRLVLSGLLGPWGPSVPMASKGQSDLLVRLAPRDHRGLRGLSGSPVSLVKLDRREIRARKAMPEVSPAMSAYCPVQSAFAWVKRPPSRRAAAQASR